LAPLFETHVRRTVMPLRLNGSRIELSLDRGELKSGRKSAPISEVEIELKRGNSTDLVTVARSVARLAPVRLGGLSKAQRGHRLVDGETEKAIKSAGVALGRRMSTAEGFRAVALACLRQIAANQSLVAQEDAEGVHQMRVGLRRLRTALSF